MHVDCIDEIYAMVKSNLYFEYIDQTGLVGLVTVCIAGSATGPTTGRTADRPARPVGLAISVRFANFDCQCMPPVSW